MSVNTITQLTGALFQREMNCATCPVLVQFSGGTSGAPQPLDQALQDLAREFAGELAIRWVNADENPELLQSYTVTKPSTLLLFDNGVPIASFPESICPGELRACLQGLLADYTPLRAEKQLIDAQCILADPWSNMTKERNTEWKEVK